MAEAPAKSSASGFWVLGSATDKLELLVLLVLRCLGII